jgi:hypothetical protein
VERGIGSEVGIIMDYIICICELKDMKFTLSRIFIKFWAVNPEEGSSMSLQDLSINVCIYQIAFTSQMMIQLILTERSLNLCVFCPYYCIFIQ